MKLSRLNLLCLCATALGLSGCFDDDLPFTNKPEYHLSGLEERSETQDYLSRILDNRTSQETEDADESDPRREAYKEEAIRADLVKALKAKGYYDGEVTFRDGDKPKHGDYDVQKGEIYRLSSIQVEPKEFSALASGLQPGDVLDAEAVLSAQEKLFALAQKDSCYFGLEINHGVVLDKDTKTGALKFKVDAGPPAKFGNVTFAGQETVKVSYLNKLIPWRRERCYQADRVERLRTRLMESGLFSSVAVRLPDGPDENGNINMIVDLKERAQRTIKAGLNYYTDEGVGATLGWEHRNFLGAAEKLQTELVLSQIEQSINAEFLKPYFMRRDQTLSLTTSLRHQDTDAFQEYGFDLGGSVTRRFNRRLSGTLGTKLNLTRIEEENDDSAKTYGLVSFPGSLSFDNRDDKLDPHKGWLINGGVSPYFDVLGESTPFLKAQLGASTYYALGTGADIVLAMRGNVGSIMGASADNIPATERFYAGGGGSVRGFGYQEVGPQEDGTPTGGRSLVTASSELRFKMTDTIGAVTFVDAGSVSEAAAPDFDNLSVGAGVGLRYYTSFGPLRFDVAVPVSGKDDLDQSYQVYISIGQAF